MRNLCLLAAVTLALLLTACRKGRETELTLAGSTSVQPFVEMVAEHYSDKHPGRRIVVQGGGSTAGVQSVRESAADIGMSSRALNDQESDLTPIVIARDGIAIIVHPSKSIDNITLQQTRDIFAGRVTQWSELGVAGGRIWLVTREEGSGTRGAFSEMVMHGEAIAPHAIVQDSNGSMRAVIADFPDGIGYVSMGLLDRSVKGLAVEGVLPTLENVKAGSYRLVRPFLFLTKGELSEPAKEFVAFVLGREGQQMFEDEGLIGLH